MSDLWTVATGLSQAMASALVSTGKAADPKVDATLRAVADPRTWLAGVGGLDEGVGKIADVPQLADLWNTERHQARVAQAGMDARRRGLEHNAVVLEAWLRAGQAFTEELGGRARADGRPPDHKAMLALWTETANRVLLDTQWSEPFLRTQAAMIRAGTELRLAQQQVAESWATSLGLPTRTKLDDVHRTVTELRRELRALKRPKRVSTAVPASPAAPGLAAPDLALTGPAASEPAILEGGGTAGYEELALPGGHVGVFVGGKSQNLFAPAVAAFLAKHNGLQQDLAGPAGSSPSA